MCYEYCIWEGWWWISASLIFGSAVGLLFRWQWWTNEQDREEMRRWFDEESALIDATFTANPVRLVRDSDLNRPGTYRFVDAERHQ